MQKPLVWVGIVFNLFVWFGTFESTRAAMREARPEVKERNAAAKAANAVAQEQAAKLSEEEASKLRESLLPRMSTLGGEMAATHQDGTEYKYLYNIKAWKTGSDDIDPGVWRALVVVTNTANHHYLNVYRAKPVITNGNQVHLALEDANREQMLGGYQSSDISVGIASMALTLGADGKWTGEATDAYNSKWKMKFMPVPITKIDEFVGAWRGKLGEYEAQFNFVRKGNELEGELNWAHSVGNCNGKVRAIYVGGDTMMMIAGGLDGHTVCLSHFVIKLAVREGKIVGAYYDRMNDEATPVSFTR